MIENQSKYYKLMDFLKQEIIMGKIKPGDRLPSENTLADEFSLSRHTVRKALAMLVNEGYIYTEQGRGAFCQDRSSKRGSSKNIVVITTYISEYIFPKVIQGIDSVLSDNGYSIILKNTNNSVEKEALCLEDVLEKNIEGLIIEPTKSALYSNNLKYYEAMDKQNIPYIFIHGFYQQLDKKPHVMLDDAEGTRLTVEYLVKLGHKRIAGIFKADDIQGINRHKGYAKALNEAGLAYDPNYVIWFHSEDKEVKPISEVRKMIEYRQGIDAFVCYNDEIAFRIYELLTGMGIRVPEDVSITGYDDSYFSSSCPVKLTTVSHPKEKLGEASAEILLQILREGNNTDNTFSKVIVPELVVKESCLKR